MKDGVSEALGTSGFAISDTSEASWGGQPLVFPRIQGADTVGRIEAVGDGVDPARIGERIIVDPWLLGTGDWLDPRNAPYHGSECDGGFAEYTTKRASNALPINSELSDEELATFPCALTTAETLVLKVDPQPGETAVITGASGGVASMAIQLCKLRGARVNGVASASKRRAAQGRLRCRHRSRGAAPGKGHPSRSGQTGRDRHRRCRRVHVHAAY